MRALCAIAVFAFVADLVVARDEIRRGTVKAVDAEKGTVTITSGGKDETFALTAGTRVMGADGQAVAKPFEDKGRSPGSAVMFKADKDGTGLVGLKFGAGNAGQPPPKFDSSKLKPLTGMGTDKYQGHEGGLYAGGTNERPKEHETAFTVGLVALFWRLVLVLVLVVAAMFGFWWEAADAVLLLLILFRLFDGGPDKKHGGH